MVFYRDFSTIIFSSSIQEFIGVFSFFEKSNNIFISSTVKHHFRVVVFVSIGIWWWVHSISFGQYDGFMGISNTVQQPFRDVINEIEK